MLRRLQRPLNTGHPRTNLDLADAAQIAPEQGFGLHKPVRPMTTPRRQTARKEAMNPVRTVVCFLAVMLSVCFLAVHPTAADEPTRLQRTRSELVTLWRARIQSILNRGDIPLIDFESFFPNQSKKTMMRRTRKIMDARGVAMLVVSGYELKSTGRGNQWSYFIQEVANKHPGYFVLATNRGANKNWWKQKGGKPKHFVDQLEREVSGGDYAFIGEVEFRHYMSSAQCRAKRMNRDIDVPLNGENGHRVFRLAMETGVAFSIHLEPEDAPLRALEEMLGAYPKARVVVAHFGQVRKPERSGRFNAALIRRLLKTYPNLYYDLSTGEPGRRYKCDRRVLDTVIWEESGGGGQTDRLKSDYRKLFADYSGRFLAGLDFGPANRQSERYLHHRIANMRLILRQLPADAQHDIGYRNGWWLLTRRRWASP